jgi:hypothetical protein
MKRNHSELLNIPLQNWSLISLEEHLEYLRDLLSFDQIHLDSSHTHIIDDCLKLEAYIEYKKENKC